MKYARRGLFGLMFLGLVCFYTLFTSSGSTPHLYAGGESVPTPKSVDFDLGQETKVTWVANVEYQVLKRHDYAKAPLLEFVNTVYQNDPNADPNLVLEVVTKAEEAYRRRAAQVANLYQAELEVGGALFDAVKAYPDLRGAALAVGRGVLKAGYYQTQSLEDALRERMVPGLARADRADAFAASRWTGLYDRTYDLASRNKKAAALVDTLLAGTTNKAKVHDLPGVIRQKNPDFDRDENVRESLALIKGGKLELSEVKDLTKKQFARLHAEVQKLSKRLAAPSEPAPAAPAFDVEGARVSVSVLSRLAGISDPKLARAIDVTGHSLVNVADSIMKFDAGKMSSIALTGNIVGAFFNVISLFDSSPSPEQLILEQLRELRQDIAQLRKEMHERFDRIDQALEQIYDSLELNFERIRKGQRDIYQEARAIRQDLLALNLKVYRLEADLRTFLKDLHEKDFELALAALDHQRFHTSKIERQAYERALDTFRLYATRLSRSPVQAGSGKILDRLGPGNPEFYTEVAAKLREEPLENNINLLGQAAQKFGSPRLPVGLPNASTWATAANSYVTLVATNWQEHGKQTPVAGTDALVETGEDLRRALQGIFYARGDEGLQPNTEFVKALLEQGYKGRSDALLVVIDRVRKKYQDDYVAGLDLWAGPDQEAALLSGNPKQVFAEVFKPMPPAVRFQMDMTAEFNANREIEAPDDILTLIPKPYLAAHRLGLGRIELAYDAHPAAYPAGEYTSVRIIGRFRIGEKRLAVFEYEGITPFKSPDFMPFSGNPDNLWRRNIIHHIWDTEKYPSAKEEYRYPERFRTKFVGRAKDVLDPKQELGSLRRVSVLVEQKLKEHRGHLDARIRDGIFNRKDSDLHQAVEQLTGAKLLVEAFLSLGLPRSVEGDDLRALLFGKDQVFDASALGGTESPLHDPKLRGVIDARQAKLAEAIMAALRKNAGPEEYPLVESTMARLSFLKKMQSSEQK